VAGIRRQIAALRSPDLTLDTSHLKLLPKLGSFCTIGSSWVGRPRPTPFRIGFVLHDWRTAPPPGPAGKLALFCRGLSNVLFTITPFPPSTCPSFWSGGNWLCLYNIPRPTPPAPPGKLGLFGAFALCSSRPCPVPQIPQLAPVWLCFAQSVSGWNGGMMEYWNIGAPEGRDWVCFARLASDWNVGIVE